MYRSHKDFQEQRAFPRGRALEKGRRAKKTKISYRNRIQKWGLHFMIYLHRSPASGAIPAMFKQAVPLFQVYLFLDSWRSVAHVPFGPVASPKWHP